MPTHDFWETYSSLWTMPFLSLVSRHANLWNQRHSFSFAMGENSELLAVNEIHLLVNWQKTCFLNAVILCLKSKGRKKKNRFTMLSTIAPLLEKHYLKLCIVICIVHHKFGLGQESVCPSRCLICMGKWGKLHEPQVFIVFVSSIYCINEKLQLVRMKVTLCNILILFRQSV